VEVIWSDAAAQHLYSAAAGAVLVVLAYRDLDGDLHGMTAWPAAGRTLRLYTDGRTS
jgi:hypothetical protein